MHDVQAETFRRNGGTPPPASADPNAAAAPAALPEAQPQQPPVPDLNPLMRRLGDLEDGLGRLTGQMEEIGHRVDELSPKTDRLQKQLDYQASQPNPPVANAETPPAAPGAPAPENSGAAVASLSPDQLPSPSRGAPPANLGQIPAGAAVPTPAAPATPKIEFDAAMGLLSRAQYEPASAAFRKFADSILTRTGLPTRYIGRATSPILRGRTTPKQHGISRSC